MASSNWERKNGLLYFSKFLVLKFSLYFSTFSFVVKNCCWQFLFEEFVENVLANMFVMAFFLSIATYSNESYWYELIFTGYFSDYFPNCFWFGRRVKSSDIFLPTFLFGFFNCFSSLYSMLFVVGSLVSFLNEDFWSLKFKQKWNWATNIFSGRNWVLFFNFQ